MVILNMKYETVMINYEVARTKYEIVKKSIIDNWNLFLDCLIYYYLSKCRKTN